MATPNSNFDELLSTTIQLLEEGLIDQILTKNALTALLKDYDQTRTKDGGPKIVIPIEFAENSSYTRYSGAGLLDTSSTEVFSSYEYPWAQIAINIQAHGREVLQNSGRSQHKDLVKARVKNAKSTFENQFNIDLISDGTLANQVVGLQTLISDLPTSGTVAGISRTTYTFARNAYYRMTTDGGVAMSSSNIVGYMDTLDLQIAARRGKTKAILSDDLSFKAYESAVHPLQRLKGEGTLGKLGFRTYQYKDAELTFEPSVSGMPASTQYWIDPEAVELIAHQDRNLVRLGKRDSFNQDAMIDYLAWMGALCANNFRKLGVLNND